MSELPEGWCDATLADLGEWSSGGTPSRKVSAYYGGTIPWVKTGDLDHAVLDRVEEFLTAEGVKNSAAKVFPEGSLLVAMYGATIGQTAVLGMDAATNQACAALLSEGETAALIPFVWRYLISIQDDLRAAGQGGAQPNISQTILKSYPISIAPLPEQQRIVSKIDSLTGKSRRARDHLDHIPRLVEKYKQAVLAAAFRGDLTREWRGENPSAKWSSHELDVLNEQRQSYLRSRRGSRLHSNGEAEASLPNGWFSAQLSDVGALQVGYAYKSKWYAADGVRLLRGANVAPGIVSWDDEVRLPHDIAADYADYRLDAGDIVIAMDRPIISTGLKVARISEEDAGCLLVQRVARYVASKLVDDDYVWHLINSQHFIDHAVTQATGSDLPHISSNDILTTPVPLPCLSEQREVARRIGTALSWIDRLASEATSARKLIDRLDQAVLAKAFRGDLVPQDPADEPASMLLDRIRAERVAAPKAKRGRKAKVL
jgi:type I restriction enzyme S subunit